MRLLRPHTVIHQSCRGVARSSRAKEAETRAMLDRMIRVDHAGEFGADRIYAGQHAILKNTEVGDTIQHMWDQEKHHLSTFNKLIPAKRARPTALLPIWQVFWFKNTFPRSSYIEIHCLRLPAMLSALGQHF